MKVSRDFKEKLGIHYAFSNVVSKIWLFWGEDVLCSVLQNKQQVVT